MGFYLTKKAKDDLRDIAKYTQKEWGIKQRDLYLTQLDSTFLLLSQTPTVGLNCDYIRLGYRKYLSGKHLIFYRAIDQNDIEIVRVLHEKMDVISRINNLDSAG